MKEGTARPIVRRRDYRPFPWLIDSLSLDFDIGAEVTTVRSRLRVLPNPAVPNWPGGLTLDGQNLELVEVSLNGRRLEPAKYRVDANHLEIDAIDGPCELEVEVRIRPERNTALEGLYPSGDFLLTQCEAEGFRKITYFPDRPDVMTRFEVTISADPARFPVLLSNGNAVASGRHPDGRHWVRWADPFRKPCYLFALVAGDLDCIEDHFITRSGRDVTLRVYVERRNAGKCAHAMNSLKRSMRWDEDRFNLEYDLDIYHIVATDDFNMGAMENKSLNIFNSKYVLALPESATDWDYQAIEGVIGHEYFHNWTGNRVTCRDWFQLTLKEGLTVFRDQEFCADMHSRAVKRIREARELRNRQFAEDAGPMSHAIRPDQYQEINNFYTLTVYQKGAEVIRMIHTLLGEDGFQRGMQRYIERHDGQAVTCDDFLAAMADANGRDLGHFARWYGQSGTPEVTVKSSFDSARQRYTLRLEQRTPPTRDQAVKLPLVIPIDTALLSPDGVPIPLQLAGEESATGSSRLLVLEQETAEFVFVNVPAEPVPSLLRGFSAPVKLAFDYTADQLALLARHDTDAFTRWEASQQVAQRAIMEARESLAAGGPAVLDGRVVEVFESLLQDRRADPALLAEAMCLPSEEYLGESMQVIDVDGIHQARRFVRRALAERLRTRFRECYRSLGTSAPYAIDAQAMARRSLKNLCLAYLAELDEGVELAQAQLQGSDNMTDTFAAIAALVQVLAPAAEPALAGFERRWREDAVVMDKWFAVQATQPSALAVQRVQSLMSHPAFSITNPNKVRSLIGAFAASNPTGFHVTGGAGYRFLADRVIELNRLNPQVAARLVSGFNNWKRYDFGRQALMRAQLERIAAEPILSPDVAEIVGNALA